MSKGTIAVIGAGPGGMATALAAIRVGFEVALFEKAPEVRAAGNILNLWPPPQKVLKLIGVDTDDLGAPCHTTFRRYDGKLRADVRLTPEVEREYGGGFIGLLRRGLYDRMMAALPEGVLRLDHRLGSMVDQHDKVRLGFANKSSFEADIVVGADGLHSFVRRALWGEQPIRRQLLHLVGGWLFDERGSDGEGVVAHDRTTQASYTPIRHEGRWGYEWWVLEAFDPADPEPKDLKTFAQIRARQFSPYLRDLIERSPVENLQRWEIRDRPPLKQWSRGRTTLVGDAAHPTSPYAAYGAGMSIEDGYFLARELADVPIRDTDAVTEALQRYEDYRKPHTSEVTEGAYKTGRLFHHMPRSLRAMRDVVFDHTPLLQKLIGQKMPAHICSQLAEIEDPDLPPLLMRA